MVQGWSGRLLEEVTPEQRPGCSEGQSHETIRKNTFRAEGTARAKFPRRQRAQEEHGGWWMGGKRRETRGQRGSPSQAAHGRGGRGGVCPRSIGVKHQEVCDLTVLYSGSPRLPCASSLWFRKKKKQGAPLKGYRNSPRKKRWRQTQV